MAKGPIPTPGTRVENVADSLRERILIGAWQPQTQLPTEQQLAQQHGVSRASIRAAISMLVAEGLLEPTQRIGTIVRDWRSEGSFRLLESLLLVHHGRNPDATAALVEQTLWLRRHFYRSTCEILCAPRLDFELPRFYLYELRYLFRKEGGIPEEVVQQEELWLCMLASCSGSAPVALFAHSLRRILDVPSRCGWAPGVSIHDATDLFAALLDALDAHDLPLAQKRIDQICRLREPQYLAFARGITKRG